MVTDDSGSFQMIWLVVLLVVHANGRPYHCGGGRPVVNVLVHNLVIYVNQMGYALASG